MRLLVVFFSIISFLTNPIIGQEKTFPKGSYMSFEEIINKAPSKQYDLKIVKRSKGEIKMNGGNDYKLISPDKELPRKVMKKQIWAHSTGDSLFINCFHYKVQPWYAHVISEGKYIIFKGGLSQYLDKQKEQIKMSQSFGAIGGAIRGAKLATLRFLYVLDKKSNEVI